MKSIQEIHDFLTNFIERKEMGAYHTPAQIDSALDISQKELFKQYLDEYINSRDKKLPVALYPFRVKDTFTSASDGTVDIPSESMYLVLIYCTAASSTFPVRMVDEIELPDALNSQLRKVTTEKPIGIEEDRQVQLYPQASRTGVYVYLREPKTPVFAYTQSGRVITYDANNSVQLEFDEVYQPKIIAKASAYLGVSMSESDIANFGNIKDTQITL